MPWSDDRLAIAFAARASASVSATPTDLLPATLLALRARPTTSNPVWRRLLAAAAVVVVAIGGLIGGAAMLGGRGGAASVVFRDGPTPDLRTLDAGTFAFDFPADWLAYDAGGASSGGSSVAVIGTQAVETRCHDADHVDINCVHEQPLAPGEIRVFIGTGAYRGGTILDRPGIANGTSTRLTIGAMPARLDAYDPSPDSFYQEDVSLAWEIAVPTSLSNVVRIEVLAREWPFRGRINTTAEVREAVEIMADSFRFAPPPTPLSSDPAITAAAARAAILTQAHGFRQGYVSNADTTSLTYLECLGDVPATSSTARIRYGPGGDLGGLVDLACTWTVEVETASIWRLDLTYDWTVAGRSDRYTETYWIDSVSTMLASTFAGEPPPATDSASGDPAEPATVLGLDVVTVADALVIQALDGDDRELAVAGWLTPAPIQHCPALGPPSPLLPGCRETWMTHGAEVLFRVRNGSMSVRTPAGPAFHPLFDALDRSWMPPPPSASDSVPIKVVVLGHFDDRRARMCSPEAQATCRDRFVVDRVARVGGVQQPLSDEVMVSGAAPRHSIGDVLALVAKVSPASEVLSVVTADNASVGMVEPELTIESPRLMLVPVKWIVRVLESDRLVTYAVADDTGTVWQMTDRGPVQADGPLAGSTDPGTWPPLRSVVVELTSDVGAGFPAVQVAVVDLSDRLEGAHDDGLPDLPLGDEIAWLNVFSEPGAPERIRLRWVGSVCDSRITVTVGADLQSITLDPGPRPPCDAIGIGRELILDFSGPVDVPGIELLRTVTTNN